MTLHYQNIMNQYNTDREYYAGRVDAAGNRYDTRSELDHAYAQLAQNMSQFNQQMALENKKLEETIRANKAQEALSRARLSRSSSGGSSSASQALKNAASIAAAGSLGTSAKNAAKAASNLAKKAYNQAQKSAARSKNTSFYVNQAKERVVLGSKNQAYNYIKGLNVSASVKREIALQAGLGPVSF